MGWEERDTVTLTPPQTLRSDPDIQEVPPQCPPPAADRCLWMRALKARPSLQLVVKFWMLTSG